MQIEKNKTTFKYKDVVKEIIKYGDLALKEISNAFIQETKEKGADIATNFDFKIEQDFIEFIKLNYPNTDFIGEELKYIEGNDLVWKMDGIDGTKYYIKEIPLWCTTLSLYNKKKKEHIFAITYNPYSKNIYVAEKNKGCYINNIKVQNNEEVDIKKAQFVLDFSTSNPLWEIEKSRAYKEYINLTERFYRTRMLGNGALATAWCAKGLFKGYYSPITREEKLIDVEAGILICQEAGLIYNKKKIGDGIYKILVTNKSINENVKNIINF